MASISSLTGGSSSSSIYGTRNVISGLASGLDTETLIENVVSGYNTKITNLQQDVTKWEWKQEAYRSMISKMSSFLSKYTSFSSSSCLKSLSYFTSAVNVTSNGTYASKVSASGKTSSDVQVLGVKQLATAASYSVSANRLNSRATTNDDGTVTATVAETDAFSLDGTVTSSTLSGTLKLEYGAGLNTSGSTVSLSFDSAEVYEDAGKLQEAIEKKLAEANIGSSDTKASEKIDVSVTGNADDGYSIKFTSTDNAYGVTVKSSPFGEVTKDGDGDNTGTMTLGSLSETKSTNAALKDGKLSITLDGTTKSIAIPSGAESEKDFIDQLQASINSAFGEGKLTVEDALTGENDGIQLQFTTGQAGSTFKVSASSSSVQSALGLGSSGLTSYTGTSSTLSDLLGDKLNGLTTAKVAAEGTVSAKKDSDGSTYYVDAGGNRVAKNESDGKYYRVDDDGEFVTGYELKINDVVVGTYAADTSLSTIISDINSSDAGVTVSYSQTTNQFTFTADETGTAGRVQMGDGLASALFGEGEYTEGRDAILSMSVNGQTYTDIARSSNTFDVDGLSITLSGTFNYEDTRVKDEATGYYVAAKKDVWGAIHAGYDENGESIIKIVKSSLLNENGEYVTEDGTVLSSSMSGGGDGTAAIGSFVDASGNAVGDSTLVANPEAVTFTSTTDSSKLVENIKQMVTDLNAILKEVKDAYSTMPETNSSGDEYEPLTDEDKADMSESAITSYEEKAKTGLLFGDSDLSGFYYQVIGVLNANVSALEAIGISQSYSDGLTSLTIDEDKLTAALEKDAESVARVFVGSGSEKGLMAQLQSPLETYGKTSGTKGILVEKAGSTLAASTLYNNEIYNKIQDINEEIEKWQDTISEKIDLYTSKFTYLEQLIANLNNQSSMIASLSGGY